MNRRTTPRVRDGRVQKKNSWRPSSGDYWAIAPDAIQFDRRRPAEGYRHLITIAHLRTLLPLLPDWDEAAIGLRAIVLDSATDCYGWYQAGVVALCNWEADLWEWWSSEEVHQQLQILDLLEVQRVPIDRSHEYRQFIDNLTAVGARATARLADVELRWTEAQARGFLLLYTLPHELGHHHDRMTNRSQTHLPRGEPYADSYAKRALETLWPIYAGHFEI
jgi:hypothetical protein